MKTLLSVQNLSLAFKSLESSNTILHGLNFNVQPNEILGVVGESGSGKSVLSLAIMGLLDQQKTEMSGQVLFDDVDLLTLSEKEQIAFLTKDVSMIFQEPMTSLNPSLTCGYQVAEVLMQQGDLSTREIKATVIDLFEKVKLPRAKTMYDQYPHQLSGGQKQRVMIAMAMACKPKLLIADEPTTALDVTVQQEVIDLLKELQQETQMSILFISHDLALVSEIAQRVLVMKKGHIVEQGTAEQIFKQPKEVYTQALIKAKPKLNIRLKELPTVASFENENHQQEIYTDEARKIHHQKIYERKPLLEVKHLKTYYGSDAWWSTDKIVKGVDDVSFDIYEEETVGLVGESGSGKSTIGRTILGLEKAKSGQVLYKGVDLLQLSSSEKKKYACEIQYIFQDPFSSLNPKMKVGQIIMEPMMVHAILKNKAERKAYVLNLLDKVGLDKTHFDRYPYEFSGGQRQRIGIARALALQPKVLICDESVAALDVSVQAQVLNLLNQLKKEFGFSYLFISHDLSVVKFMSDQLLVLQKGKLVESGDADEVYKNPKQKYTQTLINAIPKGI